MVTAGTQPHVADCTLWGVGLTPGLFPDVLRKGVPSLRATQGVTGMVKPRGAGEGAPLQPVHPRPGWEPGLGAVPCCLQTLTVPFPPGTALGPSPLPGLLSARPPQQVAVPFRPCPPFLCRQL